MLVEKTYSFRITNLLIIQHVIMKKIFFSALICLLFTMPIFAQECDESSETGFGGGFCNELDSPLDGGVSILIGLGTLYGIKRLRKEKQENDIL